MGTDTMTNTITTNWSGYNSIVLSDSMGSGGITTYSIASNSIGGTKIELKNDGLNPALVFKFVKSKLKKTEVDKLKAQAKKLQKFVKDTKELGQQAAYEELAKMLTGVVGMLELSVCGFDKYVPLETVTKFEHKVKDRVLKFDKFENFPRAIPDKIRKQIKQIQAKGLFNEYWILYLDYAGETLKTNKEKIREKDPILFGKLIGMPDKLFYLVDWVDEYCDLTLRKFVEEVKTKNPDFEMDVLPELDDKFLASLKEEVQERSTRYNTANSGNFRNLMQEEDKVNNKKPWYKFW